MKFLKDLPDLQSHPQIDYLSKHPIWSSPIRFITSDTLTSLYIEAKKDLGVETAGEIIKFITTSIVMGKMLGLIDHVQVKDFYIEEAE